MTTVAVIQARMGSTRLPGKVVADVGGMPLLELMLRRVRPAPVDVIVVATSDLTVDDAVASVADRAGVAVVRGSEHDVLGRFDLALRSHPADHVVRLTADCPLMDPTIIAEAIDTHLSARADYTSNTLVRTFPDGLDVEVMTAAALREAAREATEPDEREHVTPFLYRRPERYRLAAFRHAPFLGDERWTVDTPSDLESIRAIVAELGTISFPWTALPAQHERRWNGEARLVPHADSEPGHRRWVLEEGAGDVIGEVAVVVRGGVGTVALEVPEGRRDLALGLLRDRLRADAQVVRLAP